MKTENILTLLELAAKYEIQDHLSWNEDLDFFFPINDIFCYAADSEQIDHQDFELLEQSLKDAPGWPGIILFVARKNNILPVREIKLLEPYQKFFEEVAAKRGRLKVLAEKLMSIELEEGFSPVTGRK